jgi:glutamate racemase
VLGELKACVPVPVVDVVPPLRKAVAEAGDGQVAILGARSIIESAELQKFIRDHAGERASQVSSHNASPLIELVETGRFLTDPTGTGGSVQELMSRVVALRSVTLSSAHHPWLLPFLKDAQPRLNCFDPIEQILDEVSPAISVGSGRTAGLVSGSPNYPAADFPPMLHKLGIDIPLELTDD